MNLNLIFEFAARAPPAACKKKESFENRKGAGKKRSREEGSESQIPLLAAEHELLHVVRLLERNRRQFVALAADAASKRATAISDASAAEKRLLEAEAELAAAIADAEAAKALVDDAADLDARLAKMVAEQDELASESDRIRIRIQDLETSAAELKVGTTATVVPGDPADCCICMMGIDEDSDIGAECAGSVHHQTCKECLVNHANDVLGSADQRVVSKLLASKGILWCPLPGCDSAPCIENESVGKRYLSEAAGMRREELAQQRILAETELIRIRGELELKTVVTRETSRWSEVLPTVPECPNCAVKVFDFTGCFLVKCESCHHSFCFFCLDKNSVIPVGENDHDHVHDCAKKLMGPSYGIWGWNNNDDTDFRAAQPLGITFDDGNPVAKKKSARRWATRAVPAFFKTVPAKLRGKVMDAVWDIDDNLRGMGISKEEWMGMIE